MRQLIWLNGVASYEDAVMELVGTGVIDQARVGIAGYSRGSQMVNVTITNSSLFRAASSGDGGYLEPAFYPDVSGSYDAVFGGPPTAPVALMHYRRLSPSLRADRSEEQTSELQSLMRISYTVFCLKEKTIVTDSHL